MSNLSRYRPDIDGLRAVAVFIVVAYHAGVPGFSGGFVGVDVFFVISGFLITRILAEEKARTGTLSFRRFYAKRIRRLMPALLFTILLTLVVWTIFFTGRADIWKFPRSVRWSLLGLANVFFHKNTGGYFDESTSQMPLLHLWSLAVEEQFYFVWPLLLFWFSRIRTSLVVLVLLSFTAAQVLVAQGSLSAAFYGMPFRAWELGLGGILGLSLANLRLRRFSSWSFSAAGLLLVLVPTVFYSEKTIFPGLTALPPVLGTLLLLGAGHFAEENRITRWLCARPLVKLGVLSYGWYLWHWPLLSLAKIWTFGVPVPLYWNIALCFVALGMAEVSRRWIENPIRFAVSAKTDSAWKVLGIGFASSAAIFVLAFFVPKLEVQVLGVRYGFSRVQQIFERPPLGIDCFDEKHIREGLCDFSFSNEIKGRKNGESSNKISSTSVVVWGDSHACTFFEMVKNFAQTHHLDVSKYCQGQMPPLISDPPNRMGATVLSEITNKVKSGKSVGVFLSARWKLYARNAAELKSMEQSLKRSIHELRRVGVGRIVILLPYVDFPNATTECFLKNLDCDRTRVSVEAERKDVVEMLVRVSRGDQRIHLIDPLPVVCSAEICAQYSEEFVAVLDDNHATTEAVRRVGRKFDEELVWLTSGEG